MENLHETARINLANQKGLIRDLTQARHASGRSKQVVADLLGCEVEVIDLIENFEYDMTLSEIRVYAFAVDALIEIDITPRKA